MQACRSTTASASGSALVQRALALPPAGSIEAPARRAAPPAPGSSDLLRLAAWLDGVAAALEARLPAALAAAERAWDQADRLRLLDAELLAEREALQLGPPRDASAAAQAEAQLVAMAIGVATGWLELFERRLATLLRLRTRQGQPILDGDRPFLDPAPGLRKLAQHLRGSGGLR